MSANQMLGGIHEFDQFIATLQRRSDRGEFFFDHQKDSSGQKAFYLFPAAAAQFQRMPFVLTVDRAYKSNQFGLNALVLSGIDEECQSYVLACCLSTGESGSEYRWCIERFIHYIGKPTADRVETVLTQDDDAFHQHTNLFTNAQHCLCAQQVVNRFFSLLPAERPRVSRDDFLRAIQSTDAKRFDAYFRHLWHSLTGPSIRLCAINSLCHVPNELKVPIFNKHCQRREDGVFEAIPEHAIAFESDVLSLVMDFDWWPTALRNANLEMPAALLYLNSIDWKRIALCYTRMKCCLDQTTLTRSTGVDHHIKSLTTPGSSLISAFNALQQFVDQQQKIRADAIGHTVSWSLAELSAFAARHMTNANHWSNNFTRVHLIDLVDRQDFDSANCPLSVDRVALRTVLVSKSFVASNRCNITDVLNSQGYRFRVRCCTRPFNGPEYYTTTVFKDYHAQCTCNTPTAMRLPCNHVLACNHALGWKCGVNQCGPFWKLPLNRARIDADAISGLKRLHGIPKSSFRAPISEPSQPSIPIESEANLRQLLPILFSLCINQCEPSQLTDGDLLSWFAKVTRVDRTQVIPNMLSLSQSFNSIFSSARTKQQTLPTASNDHSVVAVSDSGSCEAHPVAPDDAPPSNRRRKFDSISVSASDSMFSQQQYMPPQQMISQQLSATSQSGLHQFSPILSLPLGIPAIQNKTQSLSAIDATLKQDGSGYPCTICADSNSCPDLQVPGSGDFSLLGLPPGVPGEIPSAFRLHLPSTSQALALPLLPIVPGAPEAARSFYEVDNSMVVETSSKRARIDRT